MLEIIADYSLIRDNNVYYQQFYLTGDRNFKALRRKNQRALRRIIQIHTDLL